MDAITLLRDDHRDVEKLFKDFEDAGDRAYVAKRRIVDRIVEELSRHAAIEEQLFYPNVKARVADSDSQVLESLEEHSIVKWLLSELDTMDPEHERFDAKTTVLIENVRHHVAEEEGELFPKVRDALGRKDLQELGEQMASAKELAPTHPHPRSPSTSPANLITGPAAAMLDLVRDTVSGAAQGSANVVRDLVSRIRGEDLRAPSPTGSSVARSTARNVRGAADAVADGVEDTLDTAAQGLSDTVDAATSGAKGTVTSARRSAGRTKSTAKRAATTTARTARSAARSTAGAAKDAAKETESAATS